MRHRAKFYAGRLNRCGDMAVFYFKRWPPPPSWIFKVTNYSTVGTIKKVELCYQAKIRRIAPTAAEIW